MRPSGHDGRVVFVSEATLTHILKDEKIKRQVTINMDAHGCLFFYWFDNFDHEESVFLPVNDKPGLNPSPNYKLKFANATSEKRYLKALKDARALGK